MALIFTDQGFLSTSRIHRHRWGILILRGAVSLTVLALALFIALLINQEGFRWFGVILALGLVTFLFCVNYFVNRRRARRSQSVASP